MNVVQLFRASVVRDPEHPCLRFQDDTGYRDWSYQQVWDHVVSFAGSLVERGIKPGDKVAIMAESSEKWMVCDFAIMALGAVVVPIYPSLTPEQASFILQSADVKCLIAGAWELVEPLENLLPELLRLVVVFEGPIKPFVRPVELFAEIALQSPVPIDMSSIDQIRAHDAATIVYTSGTSGTPKGVILTHHNLASNIEACLSVLTVKPDDVTLSYLPLSHIFERTVGHFCLLTAGGTIAYAKSLETIAQDIATVQPSVLVTVPRLLEKVYTGLRQKIEAKPAPLARFVFSCVESPVGSWKHKLAERMVFEKVRAGLGGRLRAIVSGGAGLSAQISVFYANAGISICEGYGMTETAPVIAVNPLQDIRPGTVGKPLPGVDVKLAPDGELLVRGPNVMKGYYGDSEASLQAIDAEGWLHTGDVAEIVDGYIRILERKKNLLVLATGKNVAPYPIENAITLSPVIADVVLVGEERKYVACLLVPDFEAIRAKLGLGASGDEESVETWVNNLFVRQLLQQEVRSAVRGFAEFERPKRAVLLTSPFSIESGDLTPTLKVKSKIVVQKYHQAIEDMYDGRRYLDIYGSAEVGLSDTVPPGSHRGKEEPADRTNSVANEQLEQGHMAKTLPQVSKNRNQGQRRHRRMWIAAGVAAVLVLAAGGVAFAHRMPPNLNLLSTLRKVHHTNNQINQSNNRIVLQMGKVEHLSGQSSTLAKQLTTLSSGLDQQNTNLAVLKKLSQDEIGLSQQFASLATTMNANLNDVSETTHSQSLAAARMSTKAEQIATTAGQLGQTNRQIEGKLAEARVKTQQVSNEVP